jgi:hypothetical protein
MLAAGEGGFRQVASLMGVASERNPACPCGVPGKSLILSHNAEAIWRGGFQVASPVKKPRASQMARCAPPYTDRAEEEPCQGGSALVNQVSASQVIGLDDRHERSAGACETVG